MATNCPPQKKKCDKKPSVLTNSRAKTSPLENQKYKEKRRVAGSNRFMVKTFKK